MRVLLVGSPAECAALRAQLDGTMEVAAEFASLAAARASEIDADAIVMAGRRAFAARPEPFDSPLILSPTTMSATSSS